MLSGCSPAVKEEEIYSDGFSDMFAGIMFSVWEGSDEEFKRITSKDLGDDNCIAFTAEYHAATKSEGAYFESADWGSEYLNEASRSTNSSGSDVDGYTDVYSCASAIYLNKDAEVYFSVDSIQKENGELEIIEGGYTYLGTGGVSLSEEREFKQEITTIENGTTVRGTMILRLRIEIYTREVSKDWKLLQYDENGELLGNTKVNERDSGEFKLEKNCAFVVAVETTSDGTVRTVYERGDTAYFFVDGGFGVLKKVAFTFI